MRLVRVNDLTSSGHHLCADQAVRSDAEPRCKRTIASTEREAGYPNGTQAGGHRSQPIGLGCFGSVIEVAPPLTFACWPSTVTCRIRLRSTTICP